MNNSEPKTTSRKSRPTKQFIAPGVGLRRLADRSRALFHADGRLWGQWDTNPKAVAAIATRKAARS